MSARRRIPRIVFVGVTLLLGLVIAGVGWAIERNSALDPDRVEFSTNATVSIDLRAGDRVAIYARTYRNEIFGLLVDFGYWPDDYNCAAEPSDAAILPAEGSITQRAIDGDYLWMRVAYIETPRADQFEIRCVGRFDGPMAIAAAEPLNRTSANIGEALTLGGSLVATLGSVVVAAVRLRSRRGCTEPAILLTAPHDLEH